MHPLQDYIGGGTVLANSLIEQKMLIIEAMLLCSRLSGPGHSLLLAISIRLAATISCDACAAAVTGAMPAELQAWRETAPAAVVKTCC